MSDMRLTNTSVVRAGGRLLARATSGARMLPGFLVIGTKRGGSTSLYEYLIRHPDVAGCLLTKGSHYFDVNFGRGWSWFRAAFPLAGGRRTIAGEASPYYMFHPLAPQRIVAEPGYSSFAHRHLAYLARGRYAEQLERIHALIPPSRVLVLQSEALFGDTDAELERVWRFLGLEPFRIGRPPPGSATWPPPPPGAACVRAPARGCRHGARAATRSPSWRWPPPAGSPPPAAWRSAAAPSWRSCSRWRSRSPSGSGCWR